MQRDEVLRLEHLSEIERHIIMHDRIDLNPAPIAPGLLPGHDVSMSGLYLVYKTKDQRQLLDR